MTGTPYRPHRIKLADDYTISEVIVGGWQFSAGHRTQPMDRARALDMILRLADAGFTTLDCADIYAGVEELYGEVLSKYGSTSTAGSNPLQIHTKFVPDLDALPHVERTYVERIIDRSLRRLRVERLDLVQFYWWDDSVAGSIETAHWLGELRDAGKIRCLGATNFGVARLQEMAAAGVRFVTNQVQYSLLDRRPENGLVEYCQRNDIRLLTYGTVAGGYLCSKYVGADESEHMGSTRSLTKYRLMIEEIGGWSAFQQLLAVANDVATRLGVGVASVATRFVLDQPAVAGCVLGMTRDSHLEDALATCRLKLSGTDSDLLRTTLQSVHSSFGDVYDFERDRNGPHGRIMKYNLNREGG